MEAPNQVILRGELSNLSFEYEYNSEAFYKGLISVKRLSGVKDTLPVIIPERLLNTEVGEIVTLKGEFRSRNILVKGKSKLELYIFVKDFSDEIVKNPNEIKLIGYICKKPEYRTTPFNREIADMLLAVNSETANNKSAYIPCIAWGRNARFVGNLEVGSKVVLKGRIQSREYQKKISEDEYETRTAYEVSIAAIGVEEDPNNDFQRLGISRNI